MPLDGERPTERDAAIVEELIGRTPQGDYTIVVRSRTGEPVVLMNSPLMPDGKPMPTLYWLVGRTEVPAVSRIEADGVIDRVEELIGLDAISRIHDAYEARRDALIPAGHTGPRPSAGVGGTRRGVKCLHAHLANWLAGNDDAVGEWVAARMDERGDTRAERA